MNLLKWIGAVLAFLFAIKYSTDARRAKQRSDGIVRKEVKELAKGKQANLTKAKKLGEKAAELLKQSNSAREKSAAKIKQLEEANETTLADRVRDFNKRL